MNKYLIEILKIKTSVILPGFGALMIANKKTGKIVLNKHLKFDDGVLAKFISETEGIDITEAKNMVSKFVREIESVVGKGDTYDIFQFGKISKNEKGEMIFEMDDAMKSEQTSPISGTPKKEIKPVVKKDESVENTFVPPVQKEEAKKEISKKIESKKEEIKPVVKKEETKQVKKTEDNNSKNTYVPPVTKETGKKVVEPKKEVDPDLKKKEKELAAKSKNEAKELADNKKKEAKALAAKKKEEAKIATAKAKKEKADKKKVVVLGADGKPEKKKKKRLIPLLLLLIALGCIGFVGYKYQNEIKEMIGYTSLSENHDDDDHNGESEDEHAEHADTDELVEVSEDDSLATDNEMGSENDEAVNEAENSEEVIEEIVEEVTPVVSESINGGYHIIGGGFGIESNATAYADKNGGTVLGRFDDLYLVALKSYDSRADAQADLSNVRNTASSAWIFKYSK